METAMQKLIDYKDSLINKHPDKSSYWHHSRISKMMGKLKEEEKQQLIKAYNDGVKSDGAEISEWEKTEMKENAAQYYAAKFKTD